MNSENESFKKKLDDLIQLFKKLRTKTSAEESSNMDLSLIKSLDSLIENYDMVKESFSDELLNKIGTPLQSMIQQAIDQLKEELGIENLKEPEEEIKLESISDIDNKLTESGLSTQEIDELLDQRADLSLQ